MPPCLHASSIPQTRRGFTLSELLISLAVLGLISALTLPSIVNNLKSSQERSLLRELHSDFGKLASEYAGMGLSSPSFPVWASQKLNVKRICTNGILGCTTNPSIFTGGLMGASLKRGNAGVSMELLNGGYLNITDMLQQGGSWGPCPANTCMMITVDINGEPGPNSNDCRNYCDTIQFIAGVGTTTAYPLGWGLSSRNTTVRPGSIQVVYSQWGEAFDRAIDRKLGY